MYYKRNLKTAIGTIEGLKVRVAATLNFLGLFLCGFVAEENFTNGKKI